MSSTSLVPSSSRPNALVTFEGQDAETLPITAENMDLIQSQSRVEGGQVGQFRNKETGSHVKEFYAVPISLYTNRVLFPPKVEGQPPVLGAQPLCRSNDGIRPAANVIDKKNNLCGDCAFAQWKNIGGRRVKPPCGEKLIFTFAELDSFRVFRLGVGGTGVTPLKKALKNIRNEVASAGMKAKLKMKLAQAAGEVADVNAETLTLGMDSFVIHVTTTRISGASGVYYTMNFRPFLADHKNPAIFRELYEDVKRGLAAAYAQPVVDEEGGEYMDAAIEQEMSPDGTSTPDPVIEP